MNEELIAPPAGPTADELEGRLALAFGMLWLTGRRCWTIRRALDELHAILTDDAKKRGVIAAQRERDLTRAYAAAAAEEAVR